MGPDKNKNTGAAFESMIDSIFFGEGGAEKEAADDDYIELIDDEDETTSDEE